MTNTKEVYLTLEGLNKLKEELDYYKLEKRPEVIEALKEARSLGDLSENAEYDAARSEQATVESKISELEVMIENAVIIQEVKTDVVAIGTNVKIEYIDDAEIESYSIVGSSEADPFANKISNESPLAKAILGLSAGATAQVESPNGKYSIKVIEIF